MLHSEKLKEKIYRYCVIIVIYQKDFMENAHTKIRIERVWSMPSRWTFTILPIKELLKEEVFGLSADPFAGENSPALEQNDINEDCGNLDADHKDALTWLKGRRTARYDTVLYDPPYSITQARMYGKKEFASMKYWKECKGVSAFFNISIADCLKIFIS